GTTIILVEQSVNVALTVAQTAYFMEKGEIRFHGPTRELLERGDILRSVFLEGAATVTGTETVNGSKARVGVSTNGRRKELADAEPVLELFGVSRAFGGIKAVDDVSFKLKDGQILGVIGPNGAGKTSLFDIISGFLTTDSGEIVLHGEDVTHLAPDVRAQAGLGRSFQDARLVPALTVSENIAIALERQVKTRDPLAAALNLPAVQESEKEINKRVEELIDLMGIGAFRDKFVSELSTGSRRIVDLACVLAHEPTVLLFDEPSSGIAQRETEALGPLLLRVREATGSALLIIEHDMPLVTSIADEIIALDLGRVVTQGTPQEVVNHPRVVASYLGTEEEFIARSGALSGPGTGSNPKSTRTRNKRTAKSG
ncbi:MAG: ATP-binding cassette domain-containing protein, partial [Acidimicrobiia bacterium]